MDCARSREIYTFHAMTTKPIAYHAFQLTTARTAESEKQVYLTMARACAKRPVGGVNGGKTKNAERAASRTEVLNHGDLAVPLLPGVDGCSWNFVDNQHTQGVKSYGKLHSEGVE
jgi:hypothetical protein